MQSYLQSGRFVDSDHPVVVEFAEKSRGNSAKPRDQAVALYYAVRDGVRYNPYVFSRDPQTLKASHALQQGESYCRPSCSPPAPGIAGFRRGSAWPTCATTWPRRACWKRCAARCSPCTAIPSCTSRAAG
ncbi:transglutaminase-like enzymes [Pseudomonas aeruginosa]|nr:transglutaminase-like enzymes [Pseudomonas aeruginosa]